MDLHVTASPTLGVVHYYEKGENVIDGKPQPEASSWCRRALSRYLPSLFVAGRILDIPAVGL